MSRLRAVLFDYGHTLVDFSIAEEAMWEVYADVRRFLESKAYSRLPEAHELVQQVSRRVGRSVQESYARRELEELDIVLLFEQALQGAGLRVAPEDVRQIAEMEHRAMVSAQTMSPENLGVLRRVKELGLKIGIVSNAHFLPAMMREDFHRFGIGQYVDHAVISSEVMVRKPHPAIFQAALEGLDVRPAEAVFVGDRLYDDIGGATAVGMRGILTRQFRQEDVTPEITPDLVVERLDEILPFVESLLTTR